MNVDRILIRLRTILCVTVVALVWMLTPSASRAESVLLGPADLGNPDGSLDCDGPSCYWSGLFSVTSPGSLLAAPADGTVISWRVNGEVAGSGDLALHVVRLIGPETYLGIRDSTPATSTDGVTPNETSLDLDVGDRLSVTTVSYNVSGAVSRLRTRTAPGSSYSPLGILQTGSSTVRDPMYEQSGKELLYNATVELERPEVIALSAREGSLEGGTPVTITGDHLAVATAVRFGELPATPISAGNDSITVESPPNPAGGPVDVTVTTAGGTSAASDATRFTYPDVKPPDDGKPPTISGVRFARQQFIAANIGPPALVLRGRPGRPPARVGSKVFYSLSEAATVLATVKRRNAKGRLKRAGAGFSLNGGEGRNRFFFTGRLGRKTLGPGRYTLILRARDSSGRSSKKPASARFRILG